MLDAILSLTSCSHLAVSCLLLAEPIIKAITINAHMLILLNLKRYYTGETTILSRTFFMMLSTIYKINDYLLLQFCVDYPPNKDERSLSDSE